MIDYSRAIELCDEIIHKLILDLKGLSVLTETGSGIFSVTPYLAARAGASEVYAWTSDSGYGKAVDNINLTKNFLKKTGLGNRVKFSAGKRNMEHVRRSDIVTNLGFVRPVDRVMIDNMKENAVISYMCEAWELREQDVDLAYCRKKGIKVTGVWEDHPDLKIFQSVGLLAAKLVFEAGFEIYKNNIVIWSGDNFGITIKRVFRKLGALNVTIVNSDKSLTAALNNERVDFIFIADYKENKCILGKEGLINIKKLKIGNILHLCGEVDAYYAHKNNIKLYPDSDGNSRRMVRTLAYLGYKPVIDLHGAGLKAGELLYKNKKSKLIQMLA